MNLEIDASTHLLINTLFGHCHALVVFFHESKREEMEAFTVAVKAAIGEERAHRLFGVMIAIRDTYMMLVDRMSRESVEDVMDFIEKNKDKITFN